MDGSNKKRKETDEEVDEAPRHLRITPSIQPGIEPCMGKCVECGHMGHVKLPCMQCKGDSMQLLEESNKDVELGFTYGYHRYCRHCKNVQEDGKLCRDCFTKLGEEFETVKVSETEEKELIDQKCLPRCALQHFNKCNDCLETAKYFGNNFPVEINMASNILTLCREYDALVELGYKINIDKKQDIKTRFLFEPSSLDLTTETLRSLIEHHHKMCLCSICKFWIISNAKQDEL